MRAPKVCGATSPRHRPVRPTTADACAGACDVVHLLRDAAGHEAPCGPTKLLLQPAIADVPKPPVTVARRSNGHRRSPTGHGDSAMTSAEWTTAAWKRAPNDAPERRPSPSRPQRRTARPRSEVTPRCAPTGPVWLRKPVHPVDVTAWRVCHQHPERGDQVGRVGATAPVVAAWRREHDAGMAFTGDRPAPYDAIEVPCVLGDHGPTRPARCP